MKYKLTDNCIEKNGYKLYQIQSLSHRGKIKFGQLGGYITKNSIISDDDQTWLYEDSFLINSSISNGVRVYKNTIVEDSIINGKIFIEPDSYIKNCVLNQWTVIFGMIERNTSIINKNFIFGGRIDNRITNSNYFRYFLLGGIPFICGDRYVKIGCSTYTYEDAYYILKAGDIAIDNEAHNHFKLTSIYKSNKHFLLQECKKELQRLGIKIKEGE